MNGLIDTNVQKQLEAENQELRRQLEAKNNESITNHSSLNIRYEQAVV
jgi:hypothetical protein